MVRSSGERDVWASVFVPVKELNLMVPKITDTTTTTNSRPVCVDCRNFSNSSQSVVKLGRMLRHDDVFQTTDDHCKLICRMLFVMVIWWWSHHCYTMAVTQNNNTVQLAQSMKQRPMLLLLQKCFIDLCPVEWWGWLMSVVAPTELKDTHSYPPVLYLHFGCSSHVSSLLFHSSAVPSSHKMLLILRKQNMRKTWDLHFLRIVGVVDGSIISKNTTHAHYLEYHGDLWL